MTETKKAQRSEAGWEKQRERTAEASKEKSRAGRDIAGDFPPVVDCERRASGGESFEFFCRTYLPQTFSLPWSNDHRKAIALIERVTREGGLYAFAMPRGTGKTSLTEAAVVWAVIYGYRQFPVVISSDESAALELLESVKTELETNELLLEDFPEVCYPIHKLEGISHRANGQLYDGARTHIQWTAKELVLPTIPNSVASGAVLRVTGITGRIRGMKFKTASGRSTRPDLVIVDDPQTDESAKSPSQCADREKIIAGAVMGLAGPGKKISGIMPCTVIAPDDLADRILCRDKHPEWQGERAKLVYSFPKNELLWEQYAKIRGESLRAGNSGKEATEFYRANREQMDEGSIVAWPVRFNPDELSAIQHAMNLKLADPRAFAAEFQNEPIVDELFSDALTADYIASKVNNRPRGQVPAECTRLVAFIDVQQNALFWTVCGFEEDFTGYVIDYGLYPDQKGRSHFRLNDIRRTLKSVLGVKSLEESLRLGLERLTTELLEKQWPRDDGSFTKIDRCPIDANWAQSKDVVYKFARETTYSNIVVPSHGIGVGATSRPFTDYKAKRGERKGLHWRSTLTPDRPIQRRFIIDANFWKSFAHERFRVGIGGRGCLSLYGSSPEDHRLFSEHLTSEDPVKVDAKGQTVIEWKDRPAKPDNHWFDCIVGCHAAASERGTSLAQLKPESRPPRREPQTIAQMQANRRVWTANRR